MTGQYVFSSGNLILDLLHNFLLENAARTNKLRACQMTKDPAAREMLGYLFVRRGVHAVVYGKAMEKLPGVKMTDMLPVPKMGKNNDLFDEVSETHGSPAAPGIAEQGRRKSRGGLPARFPEGLRCNAPEADR